MKSGFVRQTEPSVTGANALVNPELFGSAAVQLDSYFPALGDWVLSGRRLHSLVRTLAFNGRGHPYANEWGRAVLFCFVIFISKMIKVCRLDSFSHLRLP